MKIARAIILLPICESLKNLTEENRKDFLSYTDNRSEMKSARVDSWLIKAIGKEKTIIYQSHSKDSTKTWTQFIRAEIRNQINPFGLKKGLEGNILVGCNCPAFKWWGYSYIMTTRKSVFPGYGNTIFRKIRNPNLVGTVCKHLVSVLKRLPEDNRKIYLQLNPEERNLGAKQ